MYAYVNHLMVAYEEAVKSDNRPFVYCASKSLAERAAWDFYNKHKSEVAWDVSVMNPPFVFGPVLHEVDTPENLNESSKLWWNAIVAGKLSNEELITMGYVLIAKLSLVALR